MKGMLVARGRLSVPLVRKPAPLRRRHQRDRDREAGGAAQGGDAAAGLDGVADGADAVAEVGNGPIEIGRDEGEAPEEGGTAATGPLDRLRRLLDDLKDDAAKAEEGLPRSTRRRRLLADSPQVQASGGESGDGALEVGADRDHMVERRDAIRVRPRLGGRGDIASARRQAVKIEGEEIPQRPPHDPAPSLVLHEADPNVADDADDVLDREPARPPSRDRICHQQLVKPHRHPATVRQCRFCSPIGGQKRHAHWMWLLNRYFDGEADPATADWLRASAGTTFSAKHLTRSGSN